MQHIQNLLIQTQTCSGSPVNQVQTDHGVSKVYKAASNEESIAIIDCLFLKMAASYGNTWRNIYKNQDFLKFSKQEWLEALSGFEEQKMYQALSLCREKHVFPPTIPEFIECYRALSKKENYFRHTPIRDKSDPEIARTQINKMKIILNMK